MHDDARQRAFQVHRVREQPRLVGVDEQPGPRAGVGLRLRDVEMHAHAEIGREVGHRVEGVVGEREARVGTDEAVAAGAQEPLVLGQAGLGAVEPVAIGDLVAAAHAHADLGARFRDHVEAALDRVRRRVVVDDAGGAGLERLERAEARRPAHELQVERTVEPPPDALEDLDEGGRRPRRCRHPARQRRVEVGVRADQPGRLDRCCRPGHAASIGRSLVAVLSVPRTLTPLPLRGASAVGCAIRRRDRAARPPPRRPSAPGRSRPRPSRRRASAAAAPPRGSRRWRGRPWPG